MRRSSASNKHAGFYAKLVISLLVTMAIVVPLAVVGVRVAIRHAKLDTLTHPVHDTAQREKILNWLIRETPDDPTLVEDVADLLEHMPEEALVQVRNTLDHAGTADHPDFRAALLNQLDRLSTDTLIEVGWTLPSDAPPVQKRIIAAALPHLDRTLTDGQRDSLIALLDHFRGWSSPPVPVEHYVAWIVRGLDAELPLLRIRAAQQLGDLPLTQPEVSIALIEPPLRSLLQDTDLAVRHAALLAVAGYVPREPDLLSLIESRQNDPDPRIAALASRLIDTWHGRDVAADALTHQTSTSELLAARDWSSLLIDLETRDAGSVDVSFDPAMPHLVRVMATHAARDPQPAWLLDTFRLNDRPAVRDLACVVATRRFTPADLLPLTQQLLTDHDPDGRVSAAMLSGLTGVGTTDLRAASESEANPTTKKMMRVGLWMQGALPELDGRVAAMLGRSGLPETTLLFALLKHGDRRAALDDLLARDNASLTLLLRNQRWAHVLNAHLPSDTPRLSPRVDAALFAEQLEDLRAWHALYRHFPS